MLIIILFFDKFLPNKSMFEICGVRAPLEIFHGILTEYEMHFPAVEDIICNAHFSYLKEGGRHKEHQINPPPLINKTPFETSQKTG